MTTFSETFKRARRMAMLDQADIAEKIGVTVQCVRRWERGETKPTPKHMKKLAEVLISIPIDYVRDLLEAYK